MFAVGVPGCSFPLLGSISLPRSLAPSLPHSIAPSLPRSLDPSLPRSLACSLAPLMPRSLDASLPRPIAFLLVRPPCFFGRSLPCSFAPSLSRCLSPFAPSIPRSLAHSPLSPDIRKPKMRRSWGLSTDRPTSERPTEKPAGRLTHGSNNPGRSKGTVAESASAAG